MLADVTLKRTSSVITKQGRQFIAVESDTDSIIQMNDIPANASDPFSGYNLCPSTLLESLPNMIADELDQHGLLIKASVCTQAGLGLFTVRSIREGSDICPARALLYLDEVALDHFLRQSGPQK